MESRLNDKEYCYLCGKYMTVTNKHHILNGSMRDKCEEDGLFCYVHPTCHRYIHDHSMTARTLKKRAQKVFEEQIGTREEFIKRYGKNYIDVG